MSADEKTSDETSSQDSEIGISDDALPEDLVPGEENPLAEGLGDGESVDDLLEDGKPANESEGTDAADEPSGEEADSTS